MQLSKTRQTLKTFILALLFLVGPVVMDETEIDGVELTGDQQKHFLFYTSKAIYEKKDTEDTTKGVIVCFFVPLLEAVEVKKGNKIVGLKASEKPVLFAIKGTKKQLSELEKDDGAGFKFSNYKPNDGMEMVEKVLGDKELVFTNGGKTESQLVEATDVIKVNPADDSDTFTPESLESQGNFSKEIKIKFKTDGQGEDKDATFNVEMDEKTLKVTLDKADDATHKKITEVTLDEIADGAFKGNNGNASTESEKLEAGMKFKLTKIGANKCSLDEVKKFLAPASADGNNNGDGKTEGGLSTMAIVLIIVVIVAILGGVVFFIMNSGKE